MKLSESTYLISPCLFLLISSCMSRITAESGSEELANSGVHSAHFLSNRYGDFSDSEAEQRFVSDVVRSTLVDKGQGEGPTADSELSITDFFDCEGRPRGEITFTPVGEGFSFTPAGTTCSVESEILKVGEVSIEDGQFVECSEKGKVPFKENSQSKLAARISPRGRGAGSPPEECGLSFFETRIC